MPTSYHRWTLITKTRTRIIIFVISLFQVRNFTRGTWYDFAGWTCANTIFSVFFSYSFNNLTTNRLFISLYLYLHCLSSLITNPFFCIDDIYTIPYISSLSYHLTLLFLIFFSYPSNNNSSPIHSNYISFIQALLLLLINIISYHYSNFIFIFPIIYSYINLHLQFIKFSSFLFIDISFILSSYPYPFFSE